MTKKNTDMYKQSALATLKESEKKLKAENKALLKETQSLRKDTLIVVKRIIESKESVGLSVARHAPTAIEELAEIMVDKDVSAQTRALIAWGFVDRVGMSTAQVNKELDKHDDSSKDPSKMSIEDISKMLEGVNQQLSGMKVINADSTEG